MSGIDPAVLEAAGWQVMFFSATIAWFILRDFSRRIGEALHMRRYYLWYDAGEALVVVSAVLLFASFAAGGAVDVSGVNVLPWTGKLAFLAGMLIDVAVTARYWGWIVPEVIARRKK